MASILLLKETIKRNQFRCYYLSTKNLFQNFFSQRLKSSLNFEHFQEKDEPHCLCISEITDCEKRG